jgi:hypothetical protein
MGLSSGAWTLTTYPGEKVNVNVFSCATTISAQGSLQNSYTLVSHASLDPGKDFYLIVNALDQTIDDAAATGIDIYAGGRNLVLGGDDSTSRTVVDGAKVVTKAVDPTGTVIVCGSGAGSAWYHWKAAEHPYCTGLAFLFDGSGALSNAACTWVVVQREDH